MLVIKYKQSLKRAARTVHELRHFSGDYNDFGIPKCVSSRKPRFACGMSGGVDSTVAALLLKRSGQEVVGVFMKNWDTVEESGKVCVAEKEAEEAERICNNLGIPFQRVSFVKEYWNDVFCPMLEAYQAGETPNPDIECNRYLKYGHFHKHCLENVGCDFVATGHYARVTHVPRDQSYLLQAVDRVKDQTIFLSQIRQEALKRSVFPLGNCTKEVVKKIAASSGFKWVADKKESMGICFVGKRRDGFQGFMDQYVAPSSGNFVDIDTGEVVGKHDGIHKWTVGQGCKISGLPVRYYVVEKNLETQDITVCAGRSHPCLFSKTFFTHTPHWISEQGPPVPLQQPSCPMLECHFRFQNTQPLSKCILTLRMSDSSHMGSGLSVGLAEPQRALTVGQYAALYLGEVCLGSAKIERIGPSLYAMGEKSCRTEIPNGIHQNQNCNVT